MAASIGVTPDFEPLAKHSALSIYGSDLTQEKSSDGRPSHELELGYAVHVSNQVVGVSRSLNYGYVLVSDVQRKRVVY